MSIETFLLMLLMFVVGLASGMIMFPEINRHLRELRVKSAELKLEQLKREVKRLEWSCPNCDATAYSDLWVPRCPKCDMPQPPIIGGYRCRINV